jgi:hypothetical protein
MTAVTWSTSHTGIMIDGDQRFNVQTTSALNRLNQKPIGKDLLTLLSKRCQGYGCSIPGATVTIMRAPGSLTESVLTSKASAQGMGALQQDRVLPGTVIKLPGRGASSIVYFNPGAGTEYTELLGFQTPAHVALGHELCHALHHLSGGMRLGAGEDGRARFLAMNLHEEAHTIGLGPYKNTRISENAIRKEWGIEVRTYYAAAGDCDNLPSLVGRA